MIMMYLEKEDFFIEFPFLLYILLSPRRSDYNRFVIPTCLPVAGAGGYPEIVVLFNQYWLTSPYLQIGVKDIKPKYGFSLKYIKPLFTAKAGFLIHRCPPSKDGG